MSEYEHFYLTQVGHGRWLIRHQITDLFAGALLRTGAGYGLKNEQGRSIGNFASIEDAMRGLYATV